MKGEGPMAMLRSRRFKVLAVRVVQTSLLGHPQRVVAASFGPSPGGAQRLAVFSGRASTFRTPSGFSAARRPRQVQK